MMLIDCQTCPVREIHCADCMVTALTRLPAPGLRGDTAGLDLAHDPSRMPSSAGSDGAGGPATAPLDRAERRALSVLIGAGLVTHESANEAVAVLDPVHPSRSLTSVPEPQAQRRAM